MEYLNKEEFLKDFADRTMSNLEVENIKFEVTQLMNSLMGLLVFPTEKFFEDIQKIQFNTFLEAKIKSCVYIPNNCTMSLIQIVKKMRNAICHGHIEFVKSNTLNKDGKAEIEKICFIDCFNYRNNTCGFISQDKSSKYIDCNLCQKQREFELRISIADLKAFVKSYAKIISNYIDNKKKGTKK